MNYQRAMGEVKYEDEKLSAMLNAEQEQRLADRDPTVADQAQRIAKLEKFITSLLANAIKLSEETGGQQSEELKD
jgi:hypothetical protein